MSTTTFDDPEDRDPNGAEVYDIATGARLTPADDPAPPNAQDAPEGADDDEPDPPEPDDLADAADEDDEPIRIVRPVLRQVVYVGAGTRTVARRAWESRTTARHERMMRL